MPPQKPTAPKAFLRPTAEPYPEDEASSYRAGCRLRFSIRRWGDDVAAAKTVRSISSTLTSAPALDRQRASPSDTNRPSGEPDHPGRAGAGPMHLGVGATITTYRAAFALQTHGRTTRGGFQPFNSAQIAQTELALQGLVGRANHSTSKSITSAGRHGAYSNKARNHPVGN